MTWSAQKSCLWHGTPVHVLWEHPTSGTYEIQNRLIESCCPTGTITNHIKYLMCVHPGARLLEPFFSPLQNTQAIYWKNLLQNLVKNSHLIFRIVLYTYKLSFRPRNKLLLIVELCFSWATVIGGLAKVPPETILNGIEWLRFICFIFVCIWQLPFASLIVQKSLPEIGKHQIVTITWHIVF